MIDIRDGIIQLHTRNTSYILSTAEDGLLQGLYYGGRIKLENAQPLASKENCGYGMDVKRAPDQKALSSLRLELSATNRGDYRRGALLCKAPHGYTTDFTFDVAIVQKDTRAPSGGMPQGREPDEVLKVAMADKTGLMVEMYYSVFYDTDVISKKMRIINQGAAPVVLQRALSSQLDFAHADFDLYTFPGAWGRERELRKQPLVPGSTALFGSGTGASGNTCNPFFMLARTGAGEQQGEVYGFNLVYSGSHEASVQVDTFGRTRVLQGIWSDGFEWPLAVGESFITPEAVMTYSDKGMTGMSHNMHNFIKRQILPGRFANAERPVLVNNWEGTYFNFSETRLLKMARMAAKVGIELFVLDDGWFGNRTNDKAGLGDYTVNIKKLPSGLDGLAAKINALGMQFGLWFEPEMVNRDSDLYRAHPEWAVQTPGYEAAESRNQLALDLCRPEVRAYIIRSVNKVLASANIEYVKWDMNRHLSDLHSPCVENQGEFMHRYTLGLYQLLDGICATHPDVLFEGCSSGGNRFDLGMLYYMPQIWTSDDTDAVERQKIQQGTSYGYPPCTMGCHVSATPNHQTLRETPLETRFNTAAFGLLGYELDMSRLTPDELREIEAQVTFYKQHRRLMQYGDFYRLSSPFEGGGCRWMMVSPDKKQAMLGDFAGLMRPDSAQPPVRLVGLCDDELYNLQVRRQKVNIATFGGLINHVLPLHLDPRGRILHAAGKLYKLTSEDENCVAHGSLLRKAGILLQQSFTGTGFDADTRVVPDFGSRLYYLSAIPPREGGMGSV